MPVVQFMQRTDGDAYMGCLRMEPELELSLKGASVGGGAGDW